MLVVAAGALCAASGASEMHLLVIDHSGSMAGKSWEEMQAKAIEYVDFLEEGSHVWIAFFEGDCRRVRPIIRTITTEADRTSVTEFIRGYPSPPRNARTALFDTSGLALETVANTSARDPSLKFRVLVYTDGADNPRRVWKYRSWDDVCNAYTNLIQKGMKIDGFYVRIGGKGTASPCIPAFPDAFPLPVAVTPESDPLSLRSPTEVAEGRMPPLHFRYNDRVGAIIDGKPLKFSFVPGRNSPIKVAIEGGPYVLKKGALRIKYRVTNPQELEGSRTYSGILRIEYPGNLGKYCIQARSDFPVLFNKTTFEVYEVYPENGSKYAAGQLIQFYVRMSDKADVLWDLGKEGERRAEPKFLYAYHEAGPKKVRLRVSPAHGRGITRDIGLQIFDDSVTILPPLKPAVVGVPYTNRCTTQGDIRAVEWIIEGQPYELEVSKGKAFPYVFRAPGSNTVGAVGISANVGRLPGTEVGLLVIELPKITIEKPVEGEGLSPDEEVTIRVQTSGRVNAVLLKVLDAKSNKVLREAKVPVNPETGLAQLKHVFPAAEGERDVRVTATGEVAPELGVANVEATPVSCKVRFETPKVRITSPDNKARVPFRQSIKFTSEIGGAVRDVEWTIRKRGGSEPFHTVKSLNTDHTFSQAQGQKDLEVEVIARGIMPGSTMAEAPSDRIDLHVFCPDLNPRILLPRTNGQEITEFGLREDVPLKISIAEGQRASRVEWSCGEGSAVTGLEGESVVGCYTGYGAKRVSATVICAHCGREETSAVRTLNIVRKPPIAAFDVMKGERVVDTVGLGSTVLLKDKSSGDVCKWTWLCDGEPIGDGPGPIEYRCRRRARHTFELRVEGPDGVDPKGRPPDSRPLRVKNYLILALVALAGLLVFIPVAIFLSGDEPRFWYLWYCVSPSADATTKDLKFSTFVRLRKYWSRSKNIAKVPMKRMFATTHWTGPRGGRDTIDVSAAKIDKRLEPSVSFSAEQDAAVAWNMVTEGELYHLIDNRVETDKAKDVWFKVEKRFGPPVDTVLKIGLLFIILGVIALTWYWC